MDPMASKYASWSPYNYSFNSPTNFNDPLGDDPPDKKSPLPTDGFVDHGTGWGAWNLPGFSGGGSSRIGSGHWSDRFNDFFFGEQNAERAVREAFGVNLQAGNTFCYACGEYAGSSSDGKIQYYYNTYYQSNTSITPFDHGQRNRDAFADGFFNPNEKTNFGQPSNYVGFLGTVLIDGYRLGAAIEKAGTTGVTALARLNSTLTGARALGKYVGVLGVGLTTYEGFTDRDGFTWGDGAKVLIGLGVVFSPIGWIAAGYAVLDLGFGLATGTTITDRIGNAVDNVVYEIKRN